MPGTELCYPASLADYLRSGYQLIVLPLALLSCVGLLLELRARKGAIKVERSWQLGEMQ
jgi:hypothetical protein